VELDDPGVAEPVLRLPQSLIVTLARLSLKRPSEWRTLFAILASRNTRINTLAAIADLSPRSVKTAVAALKSAGLVRRAGGRCSRLRVATALQTQVVLPGFTCRQQRAVRACIHKISKLTGVPVRELRLPPETLRRLGLPETLTVLETYETLRLASTPERRLEFVGVVLEMANSTSVCGRELV
jgi:hypothetical protein